MTPDYKVVFGNPEQASAQISACILELRQSSASGKPTDECKRSAADLDDLEHATDTITVRCV
jgi:hypothetical protein